MGVVGAALARADGARACPQGSQGRRQGLHARRPVSIFGLFAGLAGTSMVGLPGSARALKQWRLEGRGVQGACCGRGRMRCGTAAQGRHEDACGCRCRGGGGEDGKCDIASGQQPYKPRQGAAVSVVPLLADALSAPRSGLVIPIWRVTGRAGRRHGRLDRNLSVPGMMPRPAPCSDQRPRLLDAGGELCGR